jgi:hypothetical protein
MNEQLKHAIEAMYQLSDEAQSVLAARILSEQIVRFPILLSLLPMPYI